MSKKLNKDDIARLRADFWAAPTNALLDRKTIAAGINFSVAWLEYKATAGGGIPFRKCGRLCFYTKFDVLDWLSKNSIYVRSTSEYLHQEAEEKTTEN